MPFVPGGSVTISASRLRELGLPVVKQCGGEFRHCAAHAAFIITRTLLPNLRGHDSSENWFIENVGGTLDEADDPTQFEIEHAVGKHGIRLVHQDNLSPRCLIQRGEGVFLGRFEASLNGEPVKHFFVYDKGAGMLRDPLLGQVEQVMDSDRCLNASKKQRSRANMAAMAVFYKAYGVDVGSIRITHLWQGVVGRVSPTGV